MGCLNVKPEMERVRGSTVDASAAPGKEPTEINCCDDHGTCHCYCLGLKTFIREGDAPVNPDSVARISHITRWRTLMILSITLWVLSITITVLAYYFLYYAPFFMWAWLVFGFSMGFAAIFLAYIFLNLCSPQKVLPWWWHLIVSVSVIPCGIMLLISIAFVFPDTVSELETWRLGAIEHDTARIWVRSPNHSNLTLLYKRFEDDDYTVFPDQISLLKKKDYTNVVLITGLESFTNYDFEFYSTQDVENANYLWKGSFRTAPTPGFDSTEDDEIVIFFGSCYVEGFPIFHGLKSPAPKALYQRVVPDLDLFLDLGDLIYGDVPMPMTPKQSYFNGKYRRTLNNDYIRAMFQEASNLHIFSDHELYNDWTQDAHGIFSNGVKHSWMDYLGWSNPYPTSPIPVVSGKYYFSYDYGPCSFFFLETHTARDYDWDIIISLYQMEDLKAWLSEKKDTAKYKFIISPEPWSDIFPRTGYPKSAFAWASFPDQRNEITDYIEANEISGCVFLSADKHATFVTKFWNSSSMFWEFSVSPLSAFDVTNGGLSSVNIIASEPNDYPVFSKAERRVGAAASYFGVIKVNTLENYFTVEIWDYKYTRQNDLYIIYSVNVTLDSLTF